MVSMAKIFRNGASQAVRLPREFRFDAREVCVKRIGSAVLLFPRGQAWDLMAQSLGQVDVDFAGREQPAKPDRRRSLGRAAVQGKKTSASHRRASSRSRKP